MKTKEKWINCSCGQTIGGTYISNMGYIFTCTTCGRTHRGGFWIRGWFWGLQPAWFLAWRGSRRMQRFLEKACKEALNAN